MLTLAIFWPALGERLPIKIYTMADGLARDRVTRIRNDSRGFLWFCTDEGLSRFDGYRFQNYSANDGLPHPVISDFLETHEGVYWVASRGGPCRFNPSGTAHVWNESAAELAQPDAMFVVYRPPEKNVWTCRSLCEDSAGNVWCGSTDGLYRVEREGSDWRLRRVETGVPPAESSVAAPAPASQPFTAVLSTSGGDTITIPAGKRLVVEYVSGTGFISTGEKFLTLDLSYSALVNGGPQTVQHHFVPFFIGTNNGGTPIDVYSFSQPAHFDIEPGTVQLLVLRTGGIGNFSLTISGHLE